MERNLKTVLVTEDTEAILDLEHELLEDMGFSVIDAKSGEEAIELYQKYKPDLVLMDIEMPKMCGCMAANKIHEINPDSKIIIISANEKAECGEHKSLYHVGFLAKPFDVEQFKNEILNHITVD